MRIAVASGKGGTGKTTISVNLARVFSSNVQLLDCDVEEPNTHLFLKSEILEENPVFVPVPIVDENKCNGCGECGRFCEYKAIISFGTKPLVFAEMCHGCGGCMKICPQNAIKETDRRIGIVRKSSSNNITLVQGFLDVGVAIAPPLIRAVRAQLQENIPAVLDAPPGTSCPVIAAIRGVDFVILVTEPTPFGLHDLKLAFDIVQELKLPFGVVINRFGAGDDRVHKYCEEHKIPVLLEIPDDRRIAEAYSRGEMIVDALPEYRGLFEDLLDKIKRINRY